MKPDSLRAAIGLALAIAFAAVCFFLLPDYYVYLATSAVVMALIIQSLGILTGYAALISLCQMAFCAVGAWTAMWLNLNYPDTPYLLELAAAAVVAMLIGVGIGLPALRLRGINLAAITLAFMLAVNIVLNVDGFPGEAELRPFTRPDWLSDDRYFVCFCILVFCLTSLFIAALRRRRIGAAWSAVRFSEKATAALGVSVARTKLTAFGVSAGLAGLAGALLVTQLGTLTANNFQPLGSIVIFALAIVTGSQFVEGAVLAGILSVALPELLRTVGLPVDLDSIIFGVGAVDGLRRGKSIGEAVRALHAPPTGAEEVGREIAPTPAPLIDKPPAGAIPALEIRDLTVRFGEVVALDKVSLAIPERAVTALIGPNGAGKSTLVDGVAGFIRGESGSILCGGVPLDGVPAHRRAQIGVRRTFQQGRAIPDLSIGQYVRLAAGRNIPDAELNELLAFFGCPRQAAVISSVEVGIRRLVELAAAIACRPSVLLLDEPAAGLSHAESIVLAKRIAAIPQIFGCAVMLIEHDMELVRAASGDIIVLDFGRVLARGNSRDVLHDPAVVEAYLGGTAA
jgi:branched-chain amino acid transport system permease protein